MNYWLMKSEPEVFGIDHLRARPEQTEHWDGVRNYQARNMLRDQMQIGDRVFFYHSNCAEPGIVGIARIVRAGYPDHTARNPESKYHDPKSTPENPRWYMVDVKFERKLARTVTLDELKTHAELSDMPLLRRGNRLSIMPVSPAEWEYILGLE
ncbi:MAG: EVE domain-containing protein [Gammaproteobacteria bacterium]